MRHCLSLLVLLVGLGVTSADQPVLHDLRAYQKGEYTHQPSQTYMTARKVISPLFNYDTWHRDLVAGDESSHLFMNLRYRDAGPYIFRDDDLSLVYTDLSFSTVMNVRVQQVHGSDHLSFWHGAKVGGHGNGYCAFYDDRYRLKYRLAVNDSSPGVRTDLHECQVTADGTLLLTAYNDKPFDLAPLHYNTSDYPTLADSCFQEIDIDTNALLFSWCASDHFDITLTYQTHGNYRARDLDTRDGINVSPFAAAVPEGVDVYHINSVQKTHEGHYLVSLRALKLITYINGTSGKPIWNLGGKLNDFLDITPPDVLTAFPHSEGALGFGWQHTVVFQDESLTQLAFFDNHNITTSTSCWDEICSRGRFVEINTSDRNNLTVQLIRDYRSPQGLVSQVMGSLQTLRDASDNPINVLINWGSNAEITEHTLDGRLVRDIQFSPLDPRHAFAGLPGQTSYRVFKQSWKGYPTWPPLVYNDRQGSKLYVSWNGATEIRHWAVHGSDNATELGRLTGHGYDSDYVPNALAQLRPWQVVKRAGYETEIRLGHFWPAFVKLVALDAQGEIIGSSETVNMGTNPFGCGLDCFALQYALSP